MLECDENEPAPPSACLPPLTARERRAKRRRLNTPPNTQSSGSVIDWSPSPPSLLRRATREYLNSVTSQRNLDIARSPAAASTLGLLSRPKLIRAKVTEAIEFFPFDQDQGGYTARHPLVCRLRSLIRARTVGCALCAFYERGPVVGTHKLKHCSHRDEASEVHPWFEMFRHYQARGGGLGARCLYCRFPSMLCWRTVYREEMDLKYGSEKEAREKGVWYQEVQCTWVKAMQRFVASCMVVHGRENDGGVSRLGSTVLGMMEWQDWRGLEENGPEHIQTWLEEMDELRGLQCPQLLKLF
ncbi:hypothetical protein FLAG1_10210 [Fusarium langsethiae]|uniref:Uncharacterized protein n=1 Tax=Fusarium langsethiae TaxID=179993 RepID=A0A0M9EPL6_FUSLA|nr:hypothetical protein FLAG1_10210 [Fusarium langsethiae]